MAECRRNPGALLTPTRSVREPVVADLGPSGLLRPTPRGEGQRRTATRSAATTSRTPQSTVTGDWATASYWVTNARNLPPGSKDVGAGPAPDRVPSWRPPQHRSPPSRTVSANTRTRMLASNNEPPA
jgi:hypothetical protein